MFSSDLLSSDKSEMSLKVPLRPLTPGRSPVGDTDWPPHIHRVGLELFLVLVLAKRSDGQAVHKRYGGREA